MTTPDPYRDRGAFLAVGYCYGCGRLFGFDPERVPAIPVDPETGFPPDLCPCPDPVPDCHARSIRQPVCPECMTRRAEIRAGRGQAP